MRKSFFNKQPAGKHATKSDDMTINQLKQFLVNIQTTNACREERLERLDADTLTHDTKHAR